MHTWIGSKRDLGLRRRGHNSRPDRCAAAVCPETQKAASSRGDERDQSRTIIRWGDLILRSGEGTKGDVRGTLGPNGSQASRRTDADASEGNLNVSVSASALLFLVSICPSAGVSPHTSLVLLKGSLLFCPCRPFWVGRVGSDAVRMNSS